MNEETKFKQARYVERMEHKLKDDVPRLSFKSSKTENRLVCDNCHTADNFSVLVDVYKNITEGHLEIVCLNCYYGNTVSNKILI